MHLCACMYRYGYVFNYMCIWRSQRLTVDVRHIRCFLSIATIFSKIDFLNELEDLLAKMPGQWVPGSSCLHPSCAGPTNWWCVPTIPSFMRVLETWTQILLLVLEALCSLSHLPNPPVPCLSWKKSVCCCCLFVILFLEPPCCYIYTTFAFSKKYQLWSLSIDRVNCPEKKWF